MLPSDLSAAFCLPEQLHFLLKAFLRKPPELALPRVPRHVDAALPARDVAEQERDDVEELLGVWLGIHPLRPGFSELTDPALELFGVLFGIHSSLQDLLVDALELAGVCTGIQSLIEAVFLPPPLNSKVWMLYFSPRFHSVRNGLSCTGSSSV